MQIKVYEKALAGGQNPRDSKLQLAYEITRFYYSEREAQAAQDYFIKTISQKETPDDCPTFKPSQYDIVSVLVESGSVASKSEARRVLTQKGVKVNKEVVVDPEFMLKKGDILQKGKTTFLSIV